MRVTSTPDPTASSPTSTASSPSSPSTLFIDSLAGRDTFDIVFLLEFGVLFALFILFMLLAVVVREAPGSILLPFEDALILVNAT